MTKKRLHVFSPDKNLYLLFFLVYITIQKKHNKIKTLSTLSYKENRRFCCPTCTDFLYPLRCKAYRRYRRAKKGCTHLSPPVPFLLFSAAIVVVWMVDCPAWLWLLRGEHCPGCSSWISRVVYQYANIKKINRHFVKTLTLPNLH